jgi:hypothetical protein
LINPRIKNPLPDLDGDFSIIRIDENRTAGFYLGTLERGKKKDLSSFFFPL